MVRTPDADRTRRAGTGPATHEPDPTRGSRTTSPSRMNRTPCRMNRTAPAYVTPSDTSPLPDANADRG